MSTIQEAINDKKELEVEMLKLIAGFQRKHSGLIIEAISITITKVIGYTPIQNIEASIKIN